MKRSENEERLQVIRSTTHCNNHSAESRLLDVGNNKLKMKKVREWIGKNRFNLFLTIIGLTILTYLDGHGLMIVYVVMVFLLLIFIDYREYQHLESKTSVFDVAIGSVLIFLAFFLDSIALSILDWHWIKPSFGSTDLIFLLFGIILVFYGFKNIKKFVLPIGLSLSIIVISIIPVLPFGDQIHKPFAIFTTSSAVWILNSLGYSASYVGNTITLYASHGAYSSIIERGCSGFESTLYYSIIGAFLLSKINADVWKRILVIVIGAIGTIIINIFRVTILCTAYYHWGYTMMQTFHSHLGDLMFIGWIAFIWWISFRYVLKEEK